MTVANFGYSVKLGSFVLLLPNLNLFFQSFDYERPWWRLFQKRVVGTTFDISILLDLVPNHFLIWRLCLDYKTMSPVWRTMQEKAYNTSMSFIFPYMPYPNRLVWVVRSNDLTHWAIRALFSNIRLKIKPNSVRIRFFELSNFCSSLDGIWTHTIDTLQHHSLSLTSSALDHSTTSTPYIYI